MNEMGTILTPIIPRRIVSLDHLRGKMLAVDAYVELYQFLALIRLPDGEPLRAPNGRITSHLVGLAFRLTRLMVEYGMRFVFVFDGPPHPLKLRELERRRAQRSKALREWREALARGDYETAFSKAVAALSLTKEMVEDAKRMLDLMGVPWIQAPHDAEAQAAYIVSRGDSWAVGSKDYDSLLYGAPRLVRYVTLTGTEYLPSKGIVRPLKPEIIELNEVLSRLRITRQQLVDLAILVGTDFNEGIKGIGPKRALKLIKTYGSLERLPRNIREQLPENYDKIREIFLNPPVTDKYSIEPRRPDLGGLAEFLRERGFSEKRIRTILDRLSRITVTAREESLERWLQS